MSKIFKILQLKDYITFIGTGLGIIAIICATIGNRYVISLGFFLVTITIGTDLLDGFIARKTKTVNEIGKEIDSLSDSLTFGVAPAILAFQAFKTGTLYDIFILIGCVVFALGAILRLARFNISKDSGYTGVPTPLSALFVINFFYANYFYAFALGGGDTSGLMHPFPAISQYLVPVIMILIGWLNITTLIRFGEKDKFVYRIFIIIGPLCPILGTIGILNPSFTISIIVSIIFVVGMLIEISYFVYGFIIRKKRLADLEGTS